MKVFSCPIIRLTQRTLFIAESESINSFDGLFPNTGSRLLNRQALHISTKSSKLLDLIIVKTPRFNLNSPVFFLEFDRSFEFDLITLLSPLCRLDSMQSDFEVLSAATQLQKFSEGSRLYLEEEGNMVYDKDLPESLSGYVSYVDPRSRNLGSRIISLEDCIESENMKDLSYYTMWRILHGVAEGPNIANSEPEHLNFQYFNGEEGYESDISIYSGAVLSRGKDEIDYSFNRNITNFRVLDRNQDMVGKVFEQFYNFCLIKVVKRPETELFLETGERINAWKPQYSGY